MALKPYIPFDWQNLGSPLIPFIAIKFRGDTGKFYTFPDKDYKIYILDAQINVLDNNGYSTARITLADPDFVNLETIFLKALYLSNSSSKEYWYAAIFWGWSYYGRAVGRDKIQRKTSGVHYYMLTGLTYDLDEVELKVTIELADLGAMFMKNGNDDSVYGTVGILDAGKGVTHTTTSGSGATSPNLTPGKSLTPDQMALERVASSSKKLVRKDNTIEISKTTVDDKEVSNSKTSKEVTISNTISGLNPWQAIVRLCSNHKPKILAVAYDKLPKFSEKDILKNYPIPATENFISAIHKLLNLMPRDEGPPARHWGILPGAGVLKDKLVMAFGWIPDAPSKTDTLKFSDRYRLARKLVYKPGTKGQILRGETMVNSMRYDWLSKGYFGLGMPTVYAIATDESGKVFIFSTKDDWEKKKGKVSEKNILYQSKPGTVSEPLSEIVGNPKKSYKLKGFKIDFNFDSRTSTSDLITMDKKNKRLLINVWNYLASEITEASFEIPGDPWIDNSLFTSSGKKYSDLLVNIYNAYFEVRVYRPFGKNQNVMSKLLSGKYLCLKGCTHNISEGTYTTSLNLMKAF